MKPRLLILFVGLFVLALVSSVLVYTQTRQRVISEIDPLALVGNLQSIRRDASEMYRCLETPASAQICDRRPLRLIERAASRGLVHLEEQDVLAQPLAVYGELTVLGPLLLLLVVLFLAGFWFLLRVLRPLQNLTQAVERMDLQHPHMEPIGQGPVEIRRLGRRLRDMVTRMDVQQKLLAEQSRFLGGYELARRNAHETKNHLAPLRLGLEKLFEKAGQLSADDIEKITQGLLKDLHALADYSRQTAAGAVVTPQVDVAVNLKEVLGKIVLPFCCLGMDCKLYVASDTEVAGGTQIWEMILRNLLVNALEADASQVEIRATRQQDKLTVSLQDNGTGIPEKDREKIIQFRFSTKEHGSGLGLYMVQQLLLELGGSLRVVAGNASDTRPGTTVLLEVPAWQEF